MGQCTEMALVLSELLLAMLPNCKKKFTKGGSDHCIDGFLPFPANEMIACSFMMMTTTCNQKCVLQYKGLRATTPAAVATSKRVFRYN